MRGLGGGRALDTDQIYSGSLLRLMYTNDRRTFVQCIFYLQDEKIHLSVWLFESDEWVVNGSPVRSKICRRMGPSNSSASETYFS